MLGSEHRPEMVSVHESSRLEEVSLFSVTSTVLRHWRPIVFTALAGFLLGVAFTLLRPKTFTATASFMPQASDLSQLPLAGLASQFGFNVPTGGAGESPEFYADLLRSREIIGPIVETTFEYFRKSGFPLRRDSLPAVATLIELYEIEKESHAQDRLYAIEELQSDISVRADRETSVVTVAVKTKWPHVSEQVLRQMMERVTAFNLESRRSQAAAERAFIEARLAQRQAELREVEDRLQRFLQRNRDYQDSPELVFGHDRIQRDVGLRQQVVASLMESYEQARIEEVRNTPVITMIERPELPVKRNRRGIILNAAVGLVLGAMVGLFTAFGRDFVARSRTAEPEEFATLVSLKNEALADLRRMLLPFSKARRGQSGDDVDTKVRYRSDSETT